MEEFLSEEKIKVLEEARLQIKSLDAQTVLRFLMKKVAEVLEVERVCIFQVLEELKEFRLVMGEPEKKHGIGDILPFSEFPDHVEVVRSKRQLEKKEPGLDSNIRHSKDLIYVEGITAWLILPIIIKNEVEWLLVIDAKWPRLEFTTEEKFFCQSMTELVGLVLERDRRQREIDEKEIMVIMGEAAAETAHRLRNSLVKVGGYARRLSKIVVDHPSYKDYVQQIQEGVLKMEKMLNDLLSFSRPKRVKLEKVNINEVITKVKQLVILDELMVGKNIRFDFELSPELPVILGDVADFEQLFSPILKNAVEAIQKEGRILIKTSYKEKIRVSITNSGGCIKEEILKKIFNPFFTTKEDAAGMGLALSMSIVKAYNGEIRVENDKISNLTTFIVKLPIDSEAERR